MEFKELETYLQQRFPHKRILRIDSESVANLSILPLASSSASTQSFSTTTSC
jgi:hypothetical protein